MVQNWFISPHKVRWQDAPLSMPRYQRFKSSASIHIDSLGELSLTRFGPLLNEDLLEEYCAVVGKKLYTLSAMLFHAWQKSKHLPCCRYRMANTNVRIQVCLKAQMNGLLLRCSTRILRDNATVCVPVLYHVISHLVAKRGILFATVLLSILLRVNVRESTPFLLSLHCKCHCNRDRVLRGSRAEFSLFRVQFSISHLRQTADCCADQSSLEQRVRVLAQCSALGFCEDQFLRHLRANIPGLRSNGDHRDMRRPHQPVLLHAQNTFHSGANAPSKSSPSDACITVHVQRLSGCNKVRPCNTA